MCEGSAVYSEIDLTVELLGENKFVCNGKELTCGLYASDRSLQKDHAIHSVGALEIIMDDHSSRRTSGINEDDLIIRSAASSKVSDAENAPMAFPLYPTEPMPVLYAAALSRITALL